MIVKAWKLYLDMLNLGVKPPNHWVKAQTLCFVLTKSKGLQGGLVKRYGLMTRLNRG